MTDKQAPGLMPELLECPWCYVTPRITSICLVRDTYHWVVCENQKCNPHFRSLTKEDCIKAWNTRTSSGTREESGWRPIASAPRDGTLFLAYRPTSRFHKTGTARCKDGKWMFGPFLPEIQGHSLTHWQPLPQPPQEGE